MPLPLLHLLWCPACHGDLSEHVDAVVCDRCGQRHPVLDGVVSFLMGAELDETDRREQLSRDAEASWYDTIFGEYTNIVEVPTTVARLGRPSGAVLDFGAGTGRMTTFVAREVGAPIVAVDYSIEQLRRLVPRCSGYEVLPVHADGRSLPVRDGAMAAVVSAEVYEHFRTEDRRRVLIELDRVMAPGAPLSISTLSFNLLYRLWRLKGNRGAKQGEHLLGGDFFYVRQTAREFRAELEEVFDVEEVVGIRNLPVRSLTVALTKVAGGGVAARFERFMIRRGHRLDRAMERVPLSPLSGFFLLARVRARPR